MAARCTLVIAAADLLPSLKERVGVAGGEVIAFPETEAFLALYTIAARRPDVVVRR